MALQKKKELEKQKDYEEVKPKIVKPSPSKQIKLEPRPFRRNEVPSYLGETQNKTIFDQPFLFSQDEPGLAKAKISPTNISPALYSRYISEKAGENLPMSAHFLGKTNAMRKAES